MMCALCGQRSNGSGQGWYALTETRVLCPYCKPYPRCLTCNGSLPFHAAWCRADRDRSAFVTPTY